MIRRQLANKGRQSSRRMFGRRFRAPLLPTHIAPAYAKRENLTLRMAMRRFSRLKDGSPKETNNIQRELAPYFMCRYFCRKHSPIKTSTAIKVGSSARACTMQGLVNLLHVFAR